MSQNKDLTVVLGIGLINAVIWSVFGDIVEMSDTSTYYTAWETISKCQIDVARTPVYPIYLGLLDTMFHDGGKVLAIIGQHLLFLASIYCLYQVSIKLFHNERFSFWITLFYTMCPGLFTWCNVIMTESFSISGIILLFYSQILLYEKYSFFRVFFFSFWLLFLLMLRPSFLYLPFLLICFWIYLLSNKEYRIQSYGGIVGTAIVSSMFVLYVWNFNQNYGVSLPSVVSITNRYHIARNYGLLKNAPIANHHLNDEVQFILKTNGEICEGDKVGKELKHLYSKYSYNDIDEMLSGIFPTNPKGYLKAIAQRAYNAGYINLFRGSTHVLNRLWNYFVGLQIHHLYCFLVACISFLIYKLMRRRAFPVMYWYLWGCGFCNLLVAIVGAQGDWGRLNVAVFPLYLLLIGIFIPHKREVVSFQE